MIHRSHLWSLSLAAASSAGCLDNPEPTSTIDDPIVYLGAYTLTSDSNSIACVDRDLGPSTDRTCFLTGIHGDFRGDASYPAAISTFVTSSSRWLARVCPGTGSIDGAQGVSASFACWPSVTRGRVTMSVQSGLSSSVPAVAGRQCLLTMIGTSTDSISRTDFHTGITYFAGNWFLTTGDGVDVAGAVCFQTAQPDYGEVSLVSAGPWNFSTEPLSTMSCGLTTVSYDGNGTLPTLADGVEVRYDAAGWWLDATSPKGVTARCFK